MMPEDYFDENGKLSTKKRLNALYKRYDDNKKERDREQFVTDLERFEQDKTKNALLEFGAKDQLKYVEPEQEYEFVFDESAQIAFAADHSSSIAATMSKEDMDLQLRIEAAEQKGMYLKG